MSNYYIDATRDNLEMKATEMTMEELAEEVGLLDDLADHPFTFDELVDMYVAQQFDGLARQSQHGRQGACKNNA